MVISSSHRRVATALKELPGSTEGHVLSVTDENAIADFFSRSGEFDHLVYTAAGPAGPPPSPVPMTMAAKAFFDSRLWGAYLTVCHAAPRIRDGGSVVLSSGAIGVRPPRTMAIAAALTGAVEAMARGLAVDLAPVRVNVVRPGPTRTPAWDTGGTDADELALALGQNLIVGRVGRPPEVALAYVYLMEQTFSTGAVITVDGGYALA